jgi:hypothetical protein
MMCPNCNKGLGVTDPGALYPESCPYCHGRPIYRHAMSLFQQIRFGCVHTADPHCWQDGYCTACAASSRVRPEPAASIEMPTQQCFDDEMKQLRGQEVICRNRMASDAQWAAGLKAFVCAHHSYHGLTVAEYYEAAARAGVCVTGLSVTPPSAIVDFERRNNEELGYHRPDDPFGLLPPTPQAVKNAAAAVIEPGQMVGRDAAGKLVPLAPAPSSLEVAYARYARLDGQTVGPYDRTIALPDASQLLRDENTKLLADNARKQRKIEDLERQLAKAKRR